MEPAGRSTHPPTEPGSPPPAATLNIFPLSTRALLSVAAVASVIQCCMMLLSIVSQFFVPEGDPEWLSQINTHAHVSWLLIAVAFAAVLEPSRSPFALTFARLAIVLAMIGASVIARLASALLPGNPTGWAMHTALDWLPMVATYVLARTVAIRTNDRTTRLWADIAIVAVVLAMCWSVAMVGASTRLPQSSSLPLTVATNLSTLLALPPLIFGVMLYRKLTRSLEHP